MIISLTDIPNKLRVDEVLWGNYIKIFKLFDFQIHQFIKMQYHPFSPTDLFQLESRRRRIISSKYQVKC